MSCHILFVLIIPLWLRCVLNFGLLLFVSSVVLFSFRIVNDKHISYTLLLLLCVPLKIICISFRVFRI